ncbi:MAG: TonB-dependent receptor [Acidobacteriales bacterium 59-55]|nr:carboxypeptidase regulatory-like domain-containing protein [Terriglobales bacterium]OJV44452.1 MAG: TonB-dependent receptor [Acidobacteriales bacterium 59-55]
MFRRLFKTAALGLAFLLSLSLAGSLHAQTLVGQIAGNVVDSTGGALPQAAIKITNVGTQLVRSVNTDNSGFFTVTNLPIGNYSITVSKEGFRGETRTGISVNADSHLTANFELQVGATTEAVTVTAVAGETLNTTSGEVAHVIDSKQVENLPLNGRNYTQLMTLIPGVVVTNPDIFSETTSLSAGNQNINGNKSDSNNLTVDGAFNMVSGSNNSLVNNVGPDFIQEVKIATSNFSAEYGRNSGPAFNIVTKSGTNQFHGTVFEFVRNNIFDARPFFSSSKTHLVFNDFGYGVGGPIIKDRLFFFGGQEWRRLRQQANPTQRTTPSSAQLAGNFAGLMSGGNPVILHYPGTTTPIPNNDISSLMTPDGKAIANVYTAMNKLGQYTDATNASNNLTLTPVNPLDFREDIVRLDFRINQKHSVYGRWISDHNSLIDPFGTFSAGGNLPTTPTQRNRPGQSYLFSETWAVKPSVINQATVTFSWVSQHIPPVGVNWKRETFGFQYAKLFPDAGFYPNGIPQVGITSYAGFQGPNFALNSPTTDIQFGDTVSIVKGNHLIKFGAVYIRNRVDQNGRPSYTGNISFNASNNPISTGNAMADALIGNFSSYNEASADPTGFFRFNQPEAFAQDTWKAARRLSIEYGVRWQLVPAMYTQGNNMSNFDPSVYDPAKAITVTTAGKVIPDSGNPYNGLVRAGDGVPSDQQKRVPNVNTAAFPLIPAGAPRGFYKMKGAFGPRVGFAFAPNDKTSIRGGYGIFYYRAEGNVTFSQVNIQPFLQNVEFDFANLGNISAGTPNNTGLQGSISAIDPQLKNPYVEQYSLGVQRELPKGMLLETTYVGNVGHHLLRNPNINFPDLPSVAANPKNSTNYYNPYKGFTSIAQYRSDSNSNYNSLQVYLSKRTGMVTFTAGYTWAKGLGDSQSNGNSNENWRSLDYTYGELSIDRKHAFVGTVVWQLPTFRNRNMLMRQALGGIQVTGVVRLQSGPFWTIQGNTSTGNRRADYIGGNKYAKDNRFTLANHQAQWINPAAFKATGNGTLGNSGVGTIVMPGLEQSDVTLSKLFDFHERVQLKLQADAFNVLNHTNYSSMGTNVTSSGFGALNGAYPNRQMQFGGKIIF